MTDNRCGHRSTIELSCAATLYVAVLSECPTTHHLHSPSYRGPPHGPGSSSHLFLIHLFSFPPLSFTLLLHLLTPPLNQPLEKSNEAMSGLLPLQAEAEAGLEPLGSIGQLTAEVGIGCIVNWVKSKSEKKYISMTPI